MGVNSYKSLEQNHRAGKDILICVHELGVIELDL